jgi:hypothetical protein
MAIASGGTLGTGANSTSNATFTFNTATNTLAAGDFGLLTVVSDNIATSDGPSANHTMPSGGTGTWWKVTETTNSPGGVAADGTTVSLWAFLASGTVNTGTTITVNFSGNVTDKCCSFWKFTVAAGKTLGYTTGHVNPIKNEVTASNGFGSVAFSGLASASRLYFRALGKEANSTTDLTVSSNFTLITLTRSRNNAAAQLVRGEWRINTSTGETSNPTMAVSGDTAGIFVAFEEVTKTAISGLTDNFDDNSLHANWTSGADSGTSVSETNSRLEVTGPTAGNTGYAGITSTIRYDFTGGSAYVSIPQSGLASGGSGAETQLTVLTGNVAANLNERLCWLINSDGTVVAQRVTADSAFNVFSDTYNTSTHRWFRVRHETSDDKIYWDTAPSSAANPPGGGDWVNRWSEARQNNITSAFVNLAGGVYSAVGSNFGTAQWDGFNTGTIGDTIVALTGVAGTGAAGSVGVSVDKALTGVSATGALGTLTPTFSVALTGNEATGEVGDVTDLQTTALTGVEATGAAGSVTPVFAVPITGAEATGEIGDVEPQLITEVALTGVEATGAAGSVSPVFSVALTGAEATGAVGTPGVSFAIELSGVEATGEVGTVTPDNVPVSAYVLTADFGSFTLSGQDAGLDYAEIQTAPTQVPGGGTSKKKKKKVIRFSDFAARDEFERELQAALMPLIPVSPESIYADEDDEDDILIEMLIH